MLTVCFNISLLLCTISSIKGIYKVDIYHHSSVVFALLSCTINSTNGKLLFWVPKQLQSYQSGHHHYCVVAVTVRFT